MITPQNEPFCRAPYLIPRVTMLSFHNRKLPRRHLLFYGSRASARHGPHCPKAVRCAIPRRRLPPPAQPNRRPHSLCLPVALKLRQCREDYCVTSTGVIQSRPYLLHIPNFHAVRKDDDSQTDDRKGIPQPPRFPAWGCDSQRQPTFDSLHGCDSVHGIRSANSHPRAARITANRRSRIHSDQPGGCRSRPHPAPHARMRGFGRYARPDGRPLLYPQHAGAHKFAGGGDGWHAPAGHGPGAEQ